MSGTLNTTEYVGDGPGNSGSDSGTTINHGGAQFVGYDSGTGTATSTTISGGAQYVGDYLGTGTATSTTIDRNGAQFVGYDSGTGTATSTTISGGAQYVGVDYGTGTATSTTIDGGGAQYVGGHYGTGTATNTTLSGGSQYVGVNGGIGTATSTTISGGGAQYVGVDYGTGTATNTTILSGYQDVGVGLGANGTATNTTLSGGSQDVGGNGGIGTATSTTISGGEQVVSSGGTATDTIVYSGGLAEILSGGVTNAPVIDGGTLALKKGALIGGQIDFAAIAGVNGGTLDLTGEGSGFTLAAAISGFTGTGDTAETSDIIKVAGSSASDHVVWTQNGASGTLEVEDGSDDVLESMTLDGTYFQNHFVLTGIGTDDQITYDTNVSATQYVGSGAGASGNVSHEAGSVDAASGTLDLKAAVSGAGTDIISGASTLEFDAGVAAAQTVDFTGSGGELLLDSPLSFDGQVSGFDTASAGSNDAIALLGAWSVGSFAENGAGTGGTLALSSGSSHMSLNFLGNYQNGSFTPTEVGGTTHITFAA